MLTYEVQPSTPSLCYYQNSTRQIQLVCVNQAQPQRLERVVFPGERVLFYAAPDALFDVYDATPTAFILTDRLLCSRLRVLEAMVEGSSFTRTY